MAQNHLHPGHHHTKQTGTPSAAQITPEQITAISRYVSSIYLITMSMQALSNEFRDYMASQKLAVDFQNNINSINREADAFAAKITKLIDGENKQMLFDDFEQFKKVVDKFLNLKQQ